MGMPITTPPQRHTYRGVPVTGNGVPLLKSVKKTLICGWQGDVERIGGHPDELPLEQFNPADKGIPAVYGVNKDGKVICSITLYKGDVNSKDEVERGRHIYVGLAVDTSGNA